MPSLPCLNCGVLIVSGSRCGAHAGARVALLLGRRSDAQTRAFTKPVLAKAGGRCAVIIRRRALLATKYPEAHHVVALVDRGTKDLRKGTAVCRRRHRLLA